MVITNVKLTVQLTTNPATPGFPGGSIIGEGATFDAAKQAVKTVAESRLSAAQENADVLQSLVNSL